MKLLGELASITWGLCWLCFWTYAAAACAGVAIHDPYLGEQILWCVLGYFSGCFAWHVRGEINKVRLSAIANLS